jgi:hypothetical protein
MVRRNGRLARWCVAAWMAITVAGCVTQPPPAPRVQVRKVPKPKAPDWFHQQLALARKARAGHSPHSDVEGAQLAYNRVMITACKHVAEAGPDKYRPRCLAYAKRTLHPVLVPDDSLSCGDEDDTFETPAQIKACSD